MSKFSVQLSQAIKLSGKSKNQIIEESKINRSSFFQFLNGKRMPTKEHLAAILAALQLTPGEEEQLRKLYEIAEIGENIYESRVGCAECLDDLALLTGQNRRPIHELWARRSIPSPAPLFWGKTECTRNCAIWRRRRCSSRSPRSTSFCLGSPMTS